MCMVTRVATPAPGTSPSRRQHSSPPPGLGLPSDLFQLEKILFDATCEQCSRSQADAMSSIPQGMLAARAVTANQKKAPSDTSISEFVFEHPPLKYSSKLMNSIWGLYNRYSVHNFKQNRNNVEAAMIVGQQQRFLAAVSL